MIEHFVECDCDRALGRIVTKGALHMHQLCLHLNSNARKNVASLPLTAAMAAMATTTRALQSKLGHEGKARTVVAVGAEHKRGIKRKGIGNWHTRIFLHI
jgi:hypothetical protein